MTIKNRYEFLFYIQCVNGNPNGDPDMGNAPRIDPEDLHGYITDVAIKRRIRNYIQTAYAGKPGMNIIVQMSTNINRLIAEARESAGLSPDAKQRGDIDRARAAACELYFDVRTFGGVLSTGPNAGQIRGPVQMTFARSVDPINPQDISVTRMAAAEELKDKKLAQTAENYRAQEESTPADKLRTIGRKQFIAYGLYEVRGFISANLAEETKFSESDLKAFFEATMNMYEHDRSASKGMMSVISPLIIFRHVGTDSDAAQRERQAKLGCAPAHMLFSLVHIARRAGVNVPRDFTDYTVAVDLDGRPAGVDIGFLSDSFGEIRWNVLPSGGWLHG